MNKIKPTEPTSFRMSRRMFVAGAIAVPTLAALTGCGLNSSAQGGGSSATAKRTLTIGIGQLTPSTDPRVDGASASRSSLIHVYDSLVWPDFKGGALPNIATKWETSEDLTQITFTLNPAAKFSNGEPVDAAAIKYSFDTQVDPANKSGFISILARFSGVEIVDDHTVIFHIKYPDSTAIGQLTYFYIVPPKYAAQAGWGMGGKGIGSGPMRIKSFKPNDHLTLEPNPDYWGPDENKVENVDEITWLSIESEAARRTALESGRADIVFPLSPDVWGSLKEDHRFQAYSSPLGQYQTLLLGRYNQESPLNDKRVRQAVSYAIDTASITSNIMHGTVEPTPGQLTPPGIYYNDKLSAWPFDKAKAKALLADAGYPNGFKIDMESTTGRTPADSDVCAAIVQMLREVGIEVNWTALSATEWLDKFSNATGAPLYFMNISMEPRMMPEYCLTLWTSSSFTKVMSDPVYDKMVADMLAIGDQAERAKAVQECLAYVYEAAPAAWLYQIPMLYGLSADVHDLIGNPDMSQDLQKVTFS